DPPSTVEHDSGAGRRSRPLPPNGALLWRDGVDVRLVGLGGERDRAIAALRLSPGDAVVDIGYEALEGWAAPLAGSRVSERLAGAAYIWAGEAPWGPLPAGTRLTVVHRGPFLKGNFEIARLCKVFGLLLTTARLAHRRRRRAKTLKCRLDQ